MKPSICKVCCGEYVKARPLQKVCSPTCALSHAHQLSDRKKAKEAIQDRIRTRERLAAMVTYPQLVKRAQAAFNGFIRARDAGKPCISCGRPLGAEPNTYDAGHYRSVGSAPHMRFVEGNCHGQCKHCNNHLAGNHVKYRMGLIDRMGVRAVELIEADQTARKYTREGLEELARHYRAQAKETMAAKGNA
jgi:Bacteriophage Lambda NinG protein